ncbi:MAG TPA: hypothetical protein VD768_08715 [Sphingomicrobium sp.]|nr:hypothetical protein [Sphingomicrobium sp.]
MSQTESVSDQEFDGDDSVAEALAKVLQRAQRERIHDDQLERLSGIKATTIKSYRLRTRSPSLGAGLAIAAALGEWAINAVLHPVGFQGASLEGSNELQPMQIVADALNHLGVIGQAAADNRIDHIEKPKTTEAADMLIATVLPLSSAGKRA